MAIDRRKFLKTSAAVGGALGLQGLPGLPRGAEAADVAAAAAAQQPQPAAAPVKPLRLLILGGTGFIGPHQSSTPSTAGIRSRCSIAGRPTRRCFPRSKSLWAIAMRRTAMRRSRAGSGRGDRQPRAAAEVGA